jgi:outer membrane lipoprotein-sorting protein
MIVTSLLLAAATVLGHTRAIPDQDPRAALAAMDRAVAGVDDYTMTLVSQEWRDDKLGPEQTLTAKWARPFRAYFKRLCEPNKGREILYAAGWNQNRLKVSLNTWPKRIRLNLDPHGELAMAGTRHPVDETSIVYLANVVLDNFRRADERGEATGADLGFETILGRRCRKVHLEIKQSVTTRVLGRDETLWDIEREADLAMAPLLHENRAQGWKTPGDAKPGATVRVPRYYGAKIDLWIDDELNLPLRAEIFDEDGHMFERFEHRDLRVNVGLGSEDFSPANPSYKF